jgi:excisionase family DNA binding protein
MNFPSDIRNKTGSQLLTTEQVAQLLNVSTAVIYKWISDDKLPPSIKMGNRHRWRSSDIEAWIDKGGTSASTPDC